MEAAHQAAVRAELEQVQAARPDAVWADGPAIFGPGIVFFFDGKFRTLSPDIAGAWPFVSPLLTGMLEFLPAKHSLESWRDRCESGQNLLITYVDGDRGEIVGAGMLSCERMEDGKSVALAVVCTVEELDYSELVSIIETVACVVGTDCAALATTKEPPLFSGYAEIPLGLFYAQAIPVKPIQ